MEPSFTTADWYSMMTLPWNLARLASSASRNSRIWFSSAFDARKGTAPNLRFLPSLDMTEKFRKPLAISQLPGTATAGVAAGADGLMVEVHPEPDKALSDGPQSLKPEVFEDLMSDVEKIANVLGKTFK